MPLAFQKRIQLRTAFANLYAEFAAWYLCIETCIAKGFEEYGGFDELAN